MSRYPRKVVTSWPCDLRRRRPTMSSGWSIHVSRIYLPSEKVWTVDIFLGVKEVVSRY